MKLLHDIFREAWQPPDRRPAWQWCEDYIEGIPYSPNPGRFRSENSPWIREVMEALVSLSAEVSAPLVMAGVSLVPVRVTATVVVVVAEASEPVAPLLSVRVRV